MGSNLGDREAHLVGALEALSRQPGLRLLALSSCHETAPQGGPPQPLYLNLACAIEWRGTPLQLLEVAQSIENRLGRQRGERWGPRTIDIDILLMGRRVILRDRLLVPHALLAKRAFVLAPLAEIAGTEVDPVSGKRIEELLEALPCHAKTHPHAWSRAARDGLARLGF